MTCRPITDEEAERIGLVSLAVESDEVLPTAREIAAELANGAPDAIASAKYAMNNWLRSAGPTFDNSTALEMLGFDGPEVREGVASHREKRAPNFRGVPARRAKVNLRLEGRTVLITGATGAIGGRVAA